MDAVFKRRELDVDIPERGFYCNWNLVLRSFQRDPTNVHVLVAGGAAVGFIMEMDILEVRADQRGNGYGRQLAQFMIDRAFASGQCVAQIEVAPDTALPFWRQMGFTPDETRQGPGGGIYAFRRFDRIFGLGGGARVPYRVSFYPPDRKWNPAIQAFETFAGEAERLADGRLRLPRRAYCFDDAGPTSADSVIGIEVAGALVFEDKVKRSEAAGFGVELDPDYTYYLDHIVPEGRN
jgi:GNAT superfamily N-acetyltransferase